MAQIVSSEEKRKLSWVQRIGQAIAKRWQREPASHTTTLGISQTSLDDLYNHFFDIASDRRQVYADMDTMDDTIDEFAMALDVMADYAITGEFGEIAFQVSTQSGDKLNRVDSALISSLLDRTQMYEKMTSWARDLIKYGDEFLQVVIGMDDRLVHRLMYMPPATMLRHESPDGLLINRPDPESGEGYAFTQIQPGTSKVVAKFLPYQIVHLRWRRSGGRKYGRPQGFTARVAWKKLQALEEALVMNWLTRAFARLLFIIDTTGLSRVEAEERIRAFQQRLQTTEIGSGNVGVQNMSIVKDIFIGKQFISDDRGEYQADNTDAKVLDTTSSAFWNMNPIEHYQNKIITSMGVPKGHLGIERDINAKATLTSQDRVFARRIHQLQSVMGQLVLQVIELQYALLARPMPPLKVEWVQQHSEDMVDRSQAMKNFAEAAQIFAGLELIDKDFVWQYMLKLTPSQQAALRQRVPQLFPAKEDNAPEES